ncbi:interferon-induced transmembrane protein 1-like [Pangasianodon hypophthalmus]|uniref:interferon-induced transmembrane protein 1-like n=1 Tax=Pangasianodon hypophthalmus TaxID=310915 RepID=UPI002307AD03|nr:interferon-induced transmembrane protein 1-like [Pangasianodon hypophthalmus]
MRTCPLTSNKKQLNLKPGAFQTVQQDVTLSKMQSSSAPVSIPLGDGRRAATVVLSMPDHPPDYVVWSIASLYYGNPCCLGLVALIFSMKSRDRKLMGDMTGAKMYGSNACCANGFALALFIISTIIFIVLVVYFKPFNQIHVAGRG